MKLWDFERWICTLSVANNEYVRWESNKHGCVWWEHEKHRMFTLKVTNIYMNGERERETNDGCLGWE